MRNDLIAKILIIVLIAFCIVVAPGSSNACVGRKLVLGSTQMDRASMVSRILSILIHERTGTTVEVKFFPDRDRLLMAVEKGKVDLYVDYIDSAVNRLELDASPVETMKIFSAVKKHFEEEFNLIWLKPMGYTGTDSDGRYLGPASAVVRKDTLKTFPALPRLLEKIGTKTVLDDKQLDNLVTKARTEKPSRVARSYLKEVKLI